MCVQENIKLTHNVIALIKSLKCLFLGSKRKKVMNSEIAIISTVEKFN